MASHVARGSTCSVRLIGNAGLSFISKLASGYWKITDPTNGLHSHPSDSPCATTLGSAGTTLLLRIRHAFQIGYNPRGGAGRSHSGDLWGRTEQPERVARYARFPKTVHYPILMRFFYMYLLRDFNIGSLETFVGAPSLVFGVSFGALEWARSITLGEFASTGTVMIAVLPIVIGVQLLLSAVGFDIANRPEVPLQRLLASRSRSHSGGGNKRLPEASGNCGR